MWHFYVLNLGEIRGVFSTRLCLLLTGSSFHRLVFQTQTWLFVLEFACGFRCFVPEFPDLGLAGGLVGFKPCGIFGKGGAVTLTMLHKGLIQTFGEKQQYKKEKSEQVYWSMMS